MDSIYRSPKKNKIINADAKRTEDEIRFLNKMVRLICSAAQSDSLDALVTLLEVVQLRIQRRHYAITAQVRTADAAMQKLLTDQSNRYNRRC